MRGEARPRPGQSNPLSTNKVGLMGRRNMVSGDHDCGRRVDGPSSRGGPIRGSRNAGVESDMTNLPFRGMYPHVGGGNLPTQFSNKSGRTFGE
jgi:hypothetical protein